MDIDFSIVLVSLVAFCGALWLIDSLLIKKARLTAVENYKRTQAKGRKEEEVATAIEEILKEPLAIEYAKSFLSGIGNCADFAVFPNRTFPDSDWFDDPNPRSG